MESQGSLKVEEQAQEEVRGMQCEKDSTLNTFFSGLDDGERGHERGKAGGL